MPSHFTTEHAAILREVDDFLRAFLDARLTQAPARDHPDLSLLYDSIYSYLHNGGRRMHAVSLALAFEACGGTPRTAILPVAAAFQLYHYHTLVHDDIYDEDDHRRGMRTIHRRFADWFAARPHADTAAKADGVFRTDVERRGAIAGWVQGKIVQALALDALLSAPFAGERLLPVARRFNWQDLSTNAGQFRDVAHEGRHIPDPAQCLQIAEMKTGRLFRLGAESAAELAGASAARTEALRTWIYQLAIAYQLRDDLEDLSRNSEKGRGRAVGTDLVTCKPTYLLALARTGGDPVQKAALDRWVAHPSSDPDAIADMIALLQATGAVETCVAEIRKRTDAARAALHQASPPFSPDVLARMDHFAEYFVSSEYWERTLTPLPDPLFPPERAAATGRDAPAEEPHE